MLRGRQTLGQALANLLLTAVVPPLRIGVRSQFRPNALWLPKLGWRPVNAELRSILSRFFSTPIIILALMVLPLLAIEFYWADAVRANAALALFLDIGTSVIWLAFAIELVVMVSADDHKLRYCVQHWVDLAIVLLPLVEFLPVVRLLRLARFTRTYRLQGLALKAWRALLLLDLIQRLLAKSAEKRLEDLQKLLVLKEEEVQVLRSEIERVRARLANTQQLDAATRGTLATEPSAKDLTRGPSATETGPSSATR
jgi:voltage-gated potassium channel